MAELQTFWVPITGKKVETISFKTDLGQTDVQMEFVVRGIWVMAQDKHHAKALAWKVAREVYDSEIYKEELHVCDAVPITAVSAGL